MRVRRAERPVADGYGNGLVPGLHATPDARRLVDEIAFGAGRLAELETDPPGLYAEVAALPDAEEALWLAFLIAYLSPIEGDDPFAAIRSVRTTWEGGELPDLEAVATGPRSAHEAGRGTATLEAHRAWAHRSGSQLAGLAGEASWTPERRFERAFERLSFPGFHRAARRRRPRPALAALPGLGAHHGRGQARVRHRRPDAARAPRPRAGRRRRRAAGDA
jgi:hypothetical protein